ncbi:MAG: hypothetical protein BYD32DRAFT_433906 [Podila humilis]|nr:MAG: hypothetical protein BYD32DRAFT_433906 [Podila humilis]
MQNILLLGNTGVGKTTILKVFGAPLKYDFALIGGITSGTSSIEIDIDGKKVRLIDAPKLIDDQNTYNFKNAAELANALRISDIHRVVFVYQGNEGRVLPHDVFITTMVCKSINHCLEVGLIINKVDEEDMEEYNNQENRLRIAHKLSEATNGMLNGSRIIALEYCKASERHYLKPKLLHFITILLS